MKLRVKNYGVTFGLDVLHTDYYTVQRKVLGLFWWNITYACVIRGNPRLGNRDQPILTSYDNAVRIAQRLSDPAEYEKHVKEQDAIWKAANIQFAQEAKARKQVTYI